MRRVLRLVIMLSLGGVTAPRTSDAQEPVETSLQRARATGQGVVLGSRAAAVPDIYTVRRGDTLWDITGHYYGNPWSWPEVWSYNPEITNPHWIYPLDHIRMRVDSGNEAPTVLDTGSVVAPTLRPPRDPGTVWLRNQGFLDSDALENAGVVIGSPEEKMLLSTFDEVYLRFDEDVDVQPGSDYTIFREIEEDERGEDEEGQLVRVFGTVRLRSYDRDRDIGRAIITEALDPIERGFRVAPIPRRFDVVPPRENAQDITARVVAALRPTAFAADYQLVFVNAGAEQGVQLGNRFFVVRAGDEWRSSRTQNETYGETIEGAPEPNDDDYLPEVVAEGRVVNVRPETSALLITRSVLEINIGERVEMRRGF